MRSWPATTTESCAPSVQEVAERAGVSARSVHNHFADVEALRNEVAQRQWEGAVALASLLDVELPFPARVEQLVEQRAAIWEAVTPVRRAALLQLHDSPAIAGKLAQADRALRRQIDRGFPEIDAEVLDAVDALLSWDTWNRLRTGAGLQRRARAPTRPRPITVRNARPKGTVVDERDPTQQGAVHRADERARRRARS